MFISMFYSQFSNLNDRHGKELTLECINVTTLAHNVLKLLKTMYKAITFGLLYLYGTDTKTL